MAQIGLGLRGRKQPAFDIEAAAGQDRGQRFHEKCQTIALVGGHGTHGEAVALGIIGGQTVFVHPPAVGNFFSLLLILDHLQLCHLGQGNIHKNGMLSLPGQCVGDGRITDDIALTAGNAHQLVGIAHGQRQIALLRRID